MRTGRTNGTNTYTYVYNGSHLSRMTYNGIVMNFTYDAAGTPLTIEYNGTLYYYVTNLQGDVVGILDGSGNLVVQYFYNAWGYIMRQTGSLSSTLGDQNPLRYRGYVFDPEYKLYYLESRYYNSGLGRFQNADAFTSTGQGLLGNNMYIYCNNNPVNLVDPDGNLPINGRQFGANALYHGGGNYDGGIIPDKVREAEEAKRRTGTLAVGLTAGITGGVGGSVSGGLTLDWKGNVGVIFTASGGGGFPSSGINLFVSGTNADNIYLQRELSTQVGGSGNILGISAGAEYVLFKDSNTQITYQGISVLVGYEAAFPVELHGTAGYSFVYGFNFFDVLINATRTIYDFFE